MFDNELRKEEKISGFEPGIADDDTFSLNNSMNYPGDLPDFNILENEKSLDNDTIQDDTASSLLDDSNISQDNNQTGSFWEQFDDNIQNDNSINSSIADDILSDFGNQNQELPVDDIQNMDLSTDDILNNDIQTPTSESLDDLFSDSTAFFNNNNSVNDSNTSNNINNIVDAFEFSDSNSNIIHQEEPQAINNDSENENINSEFNNSTLTKNEDLAPSFDLIDDDLKQLLMSDIEKGKSRRQVPDKSINTEDAAIDNDISDVDKLNSFKPVDDLNEAELIDLSAIKAEHPSQTLVAEDEQTQANINQESILNETESKAQTLTDDSKADTKKLIKEKKSKIKKEKSEQDSQEKKKRIIPFWMKISIPTAAALIVLLATYFGINYFKPELLDFSAKPDSVQTQAKPIVEKKETNAISKVSDTLDNQDIENIKQDSNIAIEDPIEQIQKEINEPIEEIIPEKKPAKKIEKIKVTKPIDINNKIDIAPKKIARKQQVSKPIKNLALTEESKTDKHISRKPIKIAEKKESKQTENTKTEVPTLKQDKSIYMIQVIATQSSEDAEEWLSKLQRKNIGNVTISKQIIRDKIWYRVRIGSFDSYDAAKEVALKLGYAQTWIDRIR